ncbi:MAG: SDR family NAD(P)-dependent oxidoreductase [Hyphomicrobiaceae bacterium]|nr:SDR family NAD(P)-dependent oxidoreductase [Hyphomicrobiaceae bacterium]
MADRSILITGCSSGIGLASAVMLRARGWRVLATARKPGDLQRLVDDHGLEAIHLELADAAAVAGCAGEALSRTGGRLTALFNNAAYGQPGAVEDIAPDVLRRQLEVNVVGTHDLTRRLIPAMRANGQGRVVQCSSVLGLVAAPFRGAYCASKFALEGLTDALRLELAGTGIHVSLIEPGPIRSRFVASALAAAVANVDIESSVHRERYRRMIEALERGGRQTFKLEPEAVARKLVHAVESRRPKVRYYVTAPSYAAALLKRALPARLLDAAAARAG